MKGEPLKEKNRIIINDTNFECFDYVVYLKD